MAIVNYDIQQYRQTPEHTTGVIEDYSDVQNIERAGRAISQAFKGFGDIFGRGGGRGAFGGGGGGGRSEADIAGFNEDTTLFQELVESRDMTASERSQGYNNLIRKGYQKGLSPTQINQVLEQHGFGDSQAYGKVLAEAQEATAQDMLSLQEATRRAATTMYPGLPPEEAERFYMKGLDNEILVNAELGAVQAQDQTGSYSSTSHRSLQARGASLVADNVHALAQQTRGRITREALTEFRQRQEEELMKKGFSASDATMAVAIGTQGLSSLAEDQYENSEQVLQSIKKNREILEESSAQEFFAKTFKLKDGTEIPATQLYFVTNGFQSEVAMNSILGENPDLLEAIVKGTEAPIAAIHSLSSTDVNTIWRNGASLMKSIPQGNQLITETVSNEAQKQINAPATTQGPSRNSGLKVVTEQLSQLNPTDFNDNTKQPWRDQAFPKTAEMYASGLYNQLKNKGYNPETSYPVMVNGELKFYLAATPGVESAQIIDITNADKYSRAMSNGSFVVAEDRGTILRARQEFIRNGIGSGEDFDRMMNQQFQKYFPSAQLHDPSKVSSLKAEGSPILAGVSDFVEGAANAIVEAPRDLANWLNEQLGTSDRAQQAFDRAEQAAQERGTLREDELVPAPETAQQISTTGSVLVEDLPAILDGPTDEERFDAAQSSLRAEATEAIIGEDEPYNKKSLPNPLPGSKKTEKFVRRDIVLTGEPNQAVTAPVDGAVLFAGRVGKNGPRVVAIQDTSVRAGKIWYFSELYPANLKRGDKVREGETIGNTNKQGKVRIQLRDKNKPVDPAQYFA